MSIQRVNNGGFNATGSFTPQYGVTQIPTTPSAALNAELFNIDASGFGSISVQLTGTFTAIIQYECSADRVNWIALNGYQASQGINPQQTGAGSVSLLPVFLQYLRARVASYTSGTVDAIVLGMGYRGLITASAGGASSALVGDEGVQYRASSTGAASINAVNSPVTPASVQLKASGGRIIGWEFHNSSAGLRSVKIFGVPTPTLGTTAATFEIDIPAGAYVSQKFEGGLNFAAAGFSYSVTSAKGLTDNTATGLALNDVSGAIYWI